MKEKIYSVKLKIDIVAESKQDVRYLLREILESTDEELRYITFSIQEIKINRRKSKSLSS